MNTTDDVETMALTDDLSQDTLLLSVVPAVIGFVSLFTNVLTVRTLISYPGARSTITAMCGGLAIADIIYVLFAIPTWIIKQNSVKNLVSLFWGKTIVYMSHIGAYVAAYHIVVMCIMRAVYLTRRSGAGPSFAQGVTISIALWFLGFAACVPLLLTDGYGAIIQLPLEIIPDDEPFTVLSFVCMYVIPLCICAILYVLTHLVSRRYFHDSYTPEQQRISKLVTIIVCLFTFCWLPLLILSLVTFYYDKHVYKSGYKSSVDVEDKLIRLLIGVDFLWAFAQLDKCLRPIVCAKVLPGFGRSLDEIVDCTICRRKNNDRNYFDSTPQVDPCLTNSLVIKDSCSTVSTTASPHHYVTSIDDEL